MTIREINNFSYRIKENFLFQDNISDIFFVIINNYIFELINNINLLDLCKI